jgi:hypothetical protein
MIKPYNESVRIEPGVPEALIILIMDSHGGHSKPKHSKLMKKSDVRPVWLPPHSTYFLQPLDVGVFGSSKTVYRNCRKESSETKSMIEARSYECCTPTTLPHTLEPFQFMACDRGPRFCNTKWACPVHNQPDESPEVHPG